MDAKSPETRDLIAVARERVQIGPAESWIDPCYYDKHFNPKLRGELTYLLFEKQIHAELGQTYEHVAVRLESQRAVQSNAQRQIYFEPQTESVVLHSIKIRRGESETEHASLDRIQFLQRESGLEGSFITGHITLLLLLEDVRPGDILEYSYTTTTRRRVMPENLIAFFALPTGTEIGKYRFLIQHSEKRAVNWKTSFPNFAPKITTDNGLVCCYWMDANYVSPEAEACAPVGHLMFPWIQVSDCPDWQTVARAVLNSWEKEPSGEAVARLVDEIKNFSSDPLARISRAIETVQDDFRYLSVNVELGGQIPAAPDAVIRRRYGDCKDLAFLLVQILRALGVAARPVLVHGHWRKSIASMLPSPNMFNHAIVEYEIENEKRWVDGTAKNQGGGALSRCITDFGFGLPIDANTMELAPVPKASLPTGTYEITESILLDTTGKPSCLAVVVTVTGTCADGYRNDFANSGIDLMAKERAQACANRFTEVKRIKPLEVRDDRNANEFVLAEAFEIVTPILAHKASNTCLFQIRSNFTAGNLINPGLAVRRHPLGLPFPFNLTHTVEIELTGLNSISLPVFQLGNQYFTFSRRSRSWPNRLKVAFSLETLADCIPPDKLGEHRKNVESIHEAGVINLQLPAGYSRNRPRWDFGALPPPNPSRVAAGNSVVSAQRPLSPVEGPVTTAEKETIVLQKTAELAGMPATVKPMPPAREAIQLQTAPEKPRATQRRPRKLEKRCVFAFYLFLLSAVAWLAAFPLRRYGNKELVGIDVLFVVIPTWACSLILGLFGWKQLARFPGRYTDNSKLLATLTFALGGLAGLILVPTLIVGLCAGVDYARAKNQYRSDKSQLLEFKGQNFIFHPPGDPWYRVDAQEFGPNVTLGLRRSDPMCFTIIAKSVGIMYLNPKKGMVDLSKTSMRRMTTSYHLVIEQETTYGSVSGWQIETEGSLQGRDTYFVQWITVTNGFGYLLTAWAPNSAKTQLKDEADKLFADFEPTAPEHTSASANP